jgi:predicted nucleic acid-binding protein
VIVLLDTFPASCVAKRPGSRPSLADRCHDWVDECEQKAHPVLVPALAYYEALREFERRQAAMQAERLKQYCLDPARFIPLTTEHLTLAARLWGETRRGGRSTASGDSLDGDVLLAAQALSLGLSPGEYVVATTNVSHLSRFVPAVDWTTFTP